MSAVIASGTGANSSSGTAGTVSWGLHSDVIKIRATADAVVTINGNDCTFLSSATLYTDLHVDAMSFTIKSGTINYIVIG